MLQPVRCIKFGEILMDENRRLMLLCSQCHTDYEELHEFQQHLDFCRMGGGGASTQSIFDDNVSLVFPVTTESHHLLGRYAKGNQEVYKYNGFKRLEIQAPEPNKSNTAEDEFMDLIKIEEELLDPRWYTELSSAHIVEQTVINTSHHQTASYNELVEAVTPFVQFKENFKSNEGHTKVFQTPKQPSSVKNQILNGGKPSPISVTLTEQQRRDSANMKTNSCIMPRRLPTLVVNKTLPNSNNNNITKLLTVEQLQQPNKSSNIAACGYIPKPKLTLEKAQPQQKRRIVKFLLSNTTAGNVSTVAAQATAICQPTILNAPTIPIKTEYQVNAIKAKCANEPTMVDQLPNTSCSFNTNFQQTTDEISAPPAKTMQTQQILNKLQTLGLQVKRKQPMNQQHEPTTTHDPAKEKTLQLLKKLQSKGMNVKIVQSSKQASNPNCVQQLEMPKRVRLEATNVKNEVTQMVPLNGNLIIRKLN